MYIPDGEMIPRGTYGYPEDQTFVAVGWLGRYRTIPTGEVPKGFIETLTELAFSHRARQMRGRHTCERCSMATIVLHKGAQHVVLGSAEIWVPTDKTSVFAAPDLIVHYVQDHRYLPPAEFIAAVMKLANLND